MAITTTPYSRTTWVNDSTPDIDADHLNKIETALVADRESIGELVDSDTQLAGNFAMVETSPATANHAVGEYIVYNGQLYKVTTAITAGQSLTVGTNISAVSVGGELYAIADSNKQSTGSGTINTSYATESNQAWVKHKGIVFLEIGLHLKNLSSYAETVIGSGFPPSNGGAYCISNLTKNDAPIYGAMKVNTSGQLSISLRGTSFGANAETISGQVMYIARD